VFYQGHRVGKATVVSATTFVGFEASVSSFTPPPGPDPQIAHFHRDETVTTKLGPDVFQTVSTSDYWMDPRFGTLIRQRSGQSYKNGTPTTAIGPYVYTFDHGQHDGVPVLPD